MVFTFPDLTHVVHIILVDCWNIEYVLILLYHRHEARVLVGRASSAILEPQHAELIATHALLEVQLSH